MIYAEINPNKKYLKSPMFLKSSGRKPPTYLCIRMKMKIHHPFWGNTLVFEKDAIQLMQEIFGGSASRLRDLFVPKQCFFNSSLVMLI